MIYNKNIKDGSYGIELIIDLHECDSSIFTEENLRKFVKELIEITGMKAYGEPLIWNDHNATETHLKGASIFQFIMTSDIVVHALDITGLVLINLFTCKDFNIEKTIDFAKEFFKSNKASCKILQRGKISEIQ